MAASPAVPEKARLPAPACQPHERCTTHLPTADLPADERALGRQVREIAPALRRTGVDIRASRTNRRRTLLIRRAENTGTITRPETGLSSLL